MSGARGATKIVGGARGGTKFVGGAWKGQKFAFQTVLEASGPCGKFQSRVYPPYYSSRLPTAWLVGGATAYVGRVPGSGNPLGQIFFLSDGRMSFNLAPRVNESGGGTGPELLPSVESGIVIEYVHGTAGTLRIAGILNDTTEPYIWTPSNAAAVRTFYNAVRSGDNLIFRLIY